MLKVEILSVGTELLMGQIANTNAQYLSKKLPEIGLGVYYHSVVGDNPERLISSLELALSRSDIVITTGGLGPTQDDLTKDTVAQALGLRMTVHEESRRRIKEYFERSGRVIVESNYRQAYFPDGSVILENDMGTAPGCAIDVLRGKKNKTVIMLPGPPKELIPMYEKSVVPYLREKTACHLKSKFLRVVGVSESMTEKMIMDLVDGQTNPTLATYAKDGIVTIRVSANDENGARAEELIENTVSKIRGIFGTSLYTAENEEIEETLVRMLKEKNMTLSTAESCTGGQVSQLITSVSGASSIFGCGFVTYSSIAKESLLGVPHTIIEKHGAVSMETALEMVRGAGKISGSDIAVSVTGCAGPSGMDGKPVGRVYIGIKIHDKETVKEFNFTGNRERIRTLSAINAINLVRLAIIGEL